MSALTEQHTVEPSTTGETKTERQHVQEQEYPSTAENMARHAVTLRGIIPGRLSMPSVSVSVF
jgi:hypothetical protein